MKAFHYVMVGLVTAVSFLVPLRGYAGEPSQVAADHQALAASYEEKAAVQDALIAEHTKMKQDYKTKFFVNEKVTPMGKVREMEAHCDAIIKDAEKLRSELLDFAHWHKMRAAELKGQ